MKIKSFILYYCLLFCTTCYFNAPTFTPDNFKTVYPNLVWITNEYDAGGGAQFTGIIIDKNKILTVAHGCLKPGKLKGLVFYRQGVKEVPMALVKIDKEKDLALIEFNPPFDGKPIALAKKVTWGEPVIFGGFNAMKTPRLRFGFVTQNNRGIMVHPVWYGDSGSPMVNTKNELIGIIYLMDVIVSDYTRVFTLVGYATPLEKIKEFLNDK